MTITIVVYWPGLSGDFLFDDFANLPALGRYGRVGDWDSLLRYLSSGIADPTGRPVSMLSFLVDARNWPADPLPFKRTNVLIHAANGAALYFVLVALGSRIAGTPTHARAAALVGTAAWLLHPLWASTVLYVVQRHAMLAAFFVLVGIRLWIASQDSFLRGNVARGWLFAILAVPVCGLIAGLSKSNGFLLPLLLLALQVSVLRAAGTGTTHRTRSLPSARATIVLFLVLPALLLLIAIALNGFTAHKDIIELRPWSLSERAMSQPRALLDYLYIYFSPRLDTTGLFADGFAVSTGILSPWTTLPAAFVLTALICLGLVARHRRPALSAAILFFIAGHAMESSVIPLELYFEHRNYLPSVLLVWPLTLWLTRPGKHAGLRSSATIGVLVVLSLLTLAQAQTWGRPYELAHTWGEALPNSARAQTYAASMDLQRNMPELAIARLSPLLKHNPEEIQFALTLLDAHCSAGFVPDTAIDDAEHAMVDRGVESDVTHQWLARVLIGNDSVACSKLPNDTVARLVQTATGGIGENGDPESRSRKMRVLALLALLRSDCPEALAGFNARLDIQRRPEHASQQVGLLAAECGPSVALAHLDHYQQGGSAGIAPMQTPMLRLRDRIILEQGYWEHEWRRLRLLLEAELASASSATPSRFQ